MTAREPTSYPAQPWTLHGHAYVGVWLLPRDVAPDPHSPVTPAITIFGRVLVASAFFRYEEPSALTYDEIMSTVLVRQGWRPRVSITHIWVDSPASRDGGREMWAIPKDLTRFEVAPQSSYVAPGIGSLAVTGDRRLPFRLPSRYRLAQDRDGSVLLTDVSSRVRLGVVRGRWSFAGDGPLGFLTGRRPLLTVSLRPFRMVFGSS